MNMERQYSIIGHSNAAIFLDFCLDVGFEHARSTSYGRILIGIYDISMKSEGRDGD